MPAGYWERALAGRISRRRAVAAAGGLALGSALLAACGSGGSSGGGSKGDSSGLITQPVDTSKQAKRGGIIKDRSYGDPPTLDIFTANNPLNPIDQHAYSTFVRTAPGYLKPAENTIAPDAAESWETSPDGLQITMKLRQGMKWHNKSPVNGRVLDMEDILFSWNRFAQKGSARTGVANSTNPKAPVISVTSPDKNTFVIKLSTPVVYALGLFTSNSSGSVLVLPKETDNGYNIGTDMIGTGPYVMSNYTPSVGFTFKRHADFWDKDYAYADQVDMPLISDPSQAEAQFKAGNIYSYGSYAALATLPAEEVLPIKKEEPRILIYQNDPANPAPASGTVTNFGWLPANKSPFLDERVRQAWSMAIDRDLYLDSFSNRANFESQGLPVTSFWNTALITSAAFQSWTLDPRSKDFGPNAKYFQHDPTAAKQLLSAAGYPNGFDSVSHQVTGPELATVKHAVVIDGFVSEVGFRNTVQSIDYAKDYIPNFRDGHGQFEGWAYKSSSGGPPSGGEAIGSMTVHYWSSSSLFHGFADPQMDAMIEKALIEQDTEKRRALVFDIQRYQGKAMYAMQAPGATTGFIMAWPALQNFRVFQGGRINERYWIDDTKAPFKSA